MRSSTSRGRAENLSGAAVFDFARAAGPPLREAGAELGVVYAATDGASDELGAGEHDPAPVGLGLGLDAVYVADILWRPTPQQLRALLAQHVADIALAGYRAVGAYVGKHCAPRFGGPIYTARELARRVRMGGDVSGAVAPRLRTVPGVAMTYAGHMWGRMSHDVISA